MPVCTNCRAEFASTNPNSSLCPTCEAVTTAPAPAPPAPGPLAPPARGVSALRWVLLGGLGLLVLAVLLAEGGVVTADSTETKWTSEGRNEFRSSWSGPRGRPAPLRGVGFSPTVTVSVPRGSGHDLATEAAAAIKKAAPPSGATSGARLEITITRVEPDGATWVPFHKSGSCKFTATYTLSAETPAASFDGRGEVTGAVTQTMSGLCSSGLYREKMAQAIAAAVISDINKLIAKHS